MNVDELMREATRLKTCAEREKDNTERAMHSLEAMVFYLRTGEILERDPSMENSAVNLYLDILPIIKFVSQMFQNQQSSSPEASINSKLTVLALRCQAFLFFKLFKTQRSELRECDKIFQDFHQKQDFPTEPPSGGDEDEGSVTMSMEVYTAVQNHVTFVKYLLCALHLWEHTDALLIKGNHGDFFNQLDEYCGALTFHSTLDDLDKYLQVGIQMLRMMRCRPVPSKPSTVASA